jgi:hypothetical protein
MVQSLTGDRIKQLFEQSTSETLAEANRYFVANSITYDELASELKDDFSAEHCISANDNQEVENKQILLNSLEDKSNPYRAVFAVDKLNEGWDVLNLFDIVRLYETRQSGGKNISPSTVSEAQLIGRGARYCPFQVNSQQPKYQRKYDEKQTRSVFILYGSDNVLQGWNAPLERLCGLKEFAFGLRYVVQYGNPDKYAKQAFLRFTDFNDKILPYFSENLFCERITPSAFRFLSWVSVTTCAKIRPGINILPPV